MLPPSKPGVKKILNKTKDEQTEEPIQQRVRDGSQEFDEGSKEVSVI